MALIRCPECGRQISEYAEKCPGCGWPVQQLREEEDERDEYEKRRQNGRSSSKTKTKNRRDPAFPRPELRGLPGRPEENARYIKR